MRGQRTSGALAKIRFEVTEDALYVANSGGAFDQVGVISICRQNLSSKGASAKDIRLLRCADSELIAAIQKRQLELYRVDPNLVLEDRNAESEATRDYAGRCILELLQNGDDAMAPSGATPAELIGAKGLGFKSVLEITDNPQIFSGPFRFQFDVVRSRELLADHPHASQVGVFRMPHPAEPDRKSSQLIREGFATVVRLPFRDAHAYTLAQTELRGLQPHFLLLAQHLEAVEIRLDDGTRRDLLRTGRRGDLSGAPATLRVRTGSAAWQETDWRVWRDVWASAQDRHKRLSVGIALELLDGVPVPTSEPIPLFVFYPTEDQIAARFLIHGAFDVQGNRKHVRQGDNDAALLDRMAALVSRIATDIPAEATLAIFRDMIAAAPGRKVKSIGRLLQFRMVGALKETAFIPVVGRARSKALPSEARTSAPGFAALLRPRKRAVASAGIARPELEPGFDTLIALGGTRLGQEEYAALLHHARCDGIDACITAASVMVRTCLGVHPSAATLKHLRAAPIWPTNSGTVRSLSEDRPLLLDRPANWPNWSAADALAPAFVDAVFPGKTIAKEWLPLLDGELHRTPEAYLHACIAPTLGEWSDEDWEAQGWEALERIAEWATLAEFATMKPYVPAAKLGHARDALVAVARIPTAKTWVRARHSYARTTLGAPACFARFFKDVPGRHLCAFPGEARQRFPRERWRALLRYLGVSWEPKIWKFGDEYNADLGEADDNAFWRAHSEALRYREDDWFLEAFPTCLGEDVPAGSLMTMIEDIHRASESLEGTYLKVWGAWTTHPPKPFKSFIQFQLRHTPFLPVRSNIWGTTHAVGSQAYWPKRGIPGVTPNLDLTGIKEPRRTQLRASVGKVLAVRSELPTGWDEWVEWNKALVAAAKECRIPGGERTARAFYEAMLETKFNHCGSPPDTLVCVSASSESGLEAVPRARATWIDKPAFAAPEILDALSQAGLCHLPPLLERGALAPERLKAPRASSIVRIEPDFIPADPSTRKYENLLRARWRAIAVQCDAKRVRPPAVPKIRAVNGLTLSIGLDDTPVAQISASNFLDGDTWLIDLANPTDALASALAEGVGHGADLRYRFAALLKARNREEVTRALLEDGIPPYQLTAVQLEDDPEPDEEVVPQSTGQADPGQTPGDQTANSDSKPGEESAASPPPSPPPPPPAPSSSASVVDPTRRANAQFYASGELSARPLYDPELSSGGGGGSGAGSSGTGGGGWSQRQMELGLEGEDWLAARITATAPNGVSIARNIRDHLNGESDIIIETGGQSWHVEVKTLSTERIYWSDLERGKAERNRDRYAMCLLVPYAYTYRMYWSWDPLADLLACERRMQWQWATESAGPRLAPDSWVAANGMRTPERLPDRATAVIRVQSQHLSSLTLDDPNLSMLWGRIIERPAQDVGAQTEEVRDPGVSMTGS
ncbi:hypothetical protein AAG614_11805 [Citromicrobium bathyomarinum]